MWFICMSFFKILRIVCTCSHDSTVDIVLLFHIQSVYTKYCVIRKAFFIIFPHHFLAFLYPWIPILVDKMLFVACFYRCLWGSTCDFFCLTEADALIRSYSENSPQNEEFHYLKNCMRKHTESRARPQHVAGRWFKSFHWGCNSTQHRAFVGPWSNFIQSAMKF